MINKRVATYRLQLNKDFTLFQAAKILPYLNEMGISDIYLSPIFEATRESTHGYDISDFTKISEERGGEKGLSALIDTIETVNPSFKILLDIVPNHMGIAGDNPFWLDVLAKGRKSEYWSLFDIRIPQGEKIHLPILEGNVEYAIDSGSLEITAHEKYGRGFSVNGRFLPIRTGSKGTDVSTILKEQHYILTGWTETFDKISYRRFFDITDLIGVRVEDKEVYKLSHSFLFELLRRYPSIGGVRVDHIDGLADPTAYLSFLNKDADDILVEKILARGEALPEDWHVQGTTGYEFIDYMNRTFVDSNNLSQLERYWIENIESRWPDFKSCVLESKYNALDTLFSSELKRIVSLSAKIGDARNAEIFWREMTAHLLVYRTYAGKSPLSETDREWIKSAADAARKSGGNAFSDAEKIFMPHLLDPEDDIDRQIVREWQQLTGPAMAKGLEDTAHYRYTPLAALNEVGCSPDIKEDGRTAYFNWMQETAESCPHSLLATSTHDTKRSEDTRHRLYVLADKPENWIHFYEEAVCLNSRFKEGISLRPATEYFLYQAIIGIWPLQDRVDEEFVERIKSYMKKGAKEERLDTSWLKPDPAYEKNLDIFIERILHSQDFLGHASRFARMLMTAGALTSLSVLTLKILGGGVPDIYQGAEDWDYSLVDPDNRRPVDFFARQETIDQLAGMRETMGREALIAYLCRDWKGSGIKLWLTRELLHIRAQYCCGPVDIIPLKVFGKDKASILAYAIGLQEKRERLIVICPRYVGHLVKPDTIMPSVEAQIDVKDYTSFHDLLAGKPLMIQNIMDLRSQFASFPVAVIKANFVSPEQIKR